MPPPPSHRSAIPVSWSGSQGSLWERFLAQPVEWKLHWLLRLGVFMEFVGHGAFGVKTKAGWLPFFQVFSIPDHLSWKIMPVVGSIDILLGILVLLAPRRGFLLYMAVWGTFTALLRPAAGQGWWEFLERSYNYGAPAALLVLHGWGRGFRSWLEPLRSVPRLTPPQAEKFLWGFRMVVALMLIGHGGYGAFLVKTNLLAHYDSVGLGAFGLPLESWRAGIGFFEVGLGVTALLTLRPGFYLFVFGWKLMVELLHVSAGADGAWWEVIERGGCYMVPLATLCMIHALGGRGVLPVTELRPGASPSPVA